MARNIVSQQKSIEQESVGATNETPDNYVDQLVKLIPVEIVGVYLAIQNLLSTLEGTVKAWRHAYSVPDHFSAIYSKNKSKNTQTTS